MTHRNINNPLIITIYFCGMTTFYVIIISILFLCFGLIVIKSHPNFIFKFRCLLIVSSIEFSLSNTSVKLLCCDF